jgi:hypothetical protein
MTKSRADFFTQIRPIRLGDLGTGEKKCILFMIGADICHFVFLANAEHSPKTRSRISHAWAPLSYKKSFLCFVILHYVIVYNM